MAGTFQCGAGFFQLAGQVLNRLVVAGRFCALVGFFDVLPRANGKDIEQGKRNGYSCSPIGPLKPEAVQSVRDGAVHVCAAASSENGGLKIKLRVIRTLQNLLSSVRLIHPGFLGDRNWMCGGGPTRQRGRGGKIEQRACIDLNPRPCDSQNVGQRGAAYLFGLFSPNELRPRPRQLGIGSRGVRPRPQLAVDQHPYRPGEYFPPFHIRARGLDSLLSSHQSHKSTRRGDRHVEARNVGLRTRSALSGLGGADSCPPVSKVKWFPRKQQACGASPHALIGSRRQHRSGNRGNDRIREIEAEDVVSGSAVGLPKCICAWQVARARQADTRACCSNSLTCRADGRVICQGVINGLVERE